MNKTIVLPAIIILILLTMANVIGRNWFARVDLTDNKRYSLSESSRSVVDKIDDLLTMKVYFSDNLPGEYGNTRRYLQDILEEYAAMSGGNIRFEFYEPETEEELTKEAQSSGIQPVQMQVVEDDKLEIKKVYMGMAILYEDQKEVLPVIRTTAGLEYEITTKIKMLTDKEKQIVGIYKQEERNISNENVSRLLRQRYRVREVDLKKTVPDNISVLLLNGFEDSLDPEIRLNIEEFVSKGGNLFVGQSRVKVDLAVQRASVIESDIFDLLKQYGFTLSENLVLDRFARKVTVSQQVGFFQMNVPMNYPFLPTVSSFAEGEPMVAGLEQVQTTFVSEIITDSTASNITLYPLFMTSDHSNVMTGRYNIHPDPNVNSALKRLNKPGKLVAARSEILGTDGENVAQVVLVSDSEFFVDKGGGAFAENHVFIMNAVDFLMGDRELISLRSREITSRPLEEIPDSTRRTWKWVNTILPSLLIIGFSLIRLRRQKKRSNMLGELYD